MMLQRVIFGFMVMGCVVGCVFAGLGGLSDSQIGNNRAIRSLSIVLLTCYLILVLIWTISVILAYMYGITLHGKRVHAQPERSSARVHIATANIFTVDTNSRGSEVRELKQQNRLLQQQVSVQQQLLEQQRQQQQQQIRQPVPPSTSYERGDTPPPPYSMVVGGVPSPATYKK